MNRKPFNAPYRMMLIIGIISTLSTLETVRYMMRADAFSLGRIWIFWLPLLFFVEAGVYWVLRMRIVRGANVWAHIFLLMGAFLLPYITNLFADYFYPGDRWRPGSIWLWVRNAGYIGYWLLMILGHVFFVVVLKNDLAPRVPAVAAGPGEGRDLLDDIVEDPTINLR